MTASLKPAAAEELVNLVVVDYAGIMRGRALPRRTFEAGAGAKSCGWVPANMSLTPFNVIASPNPWGSLGDLRLLADASARYRCHPPGARSAMDLVLSDIVELDGRPWTACPRSFLKSALSEFKSATGSTILASFEHEFQILDAEWAAAPSFALSALRRADPFAPELVGTLRQGGLEPEMIVAEYGADQFEVTVAPAEGLTAADRAAVLREIVRELARLHGWRASFTPKTSVGGVGNGVHVHLSFVNAKGEPTAHDARRPGTLSALAGSFCAGILEHLPALTAFTAGSPSSGLRLRPHNWSASYTWLGEQDREASLRICPAGPAGSKEAARRFNIEYRAADATSSPHLALGAIIRAGLDGIVRSLPTPPIFSGDPDLLDNADREAMGLRRLPTTLSEALLALEADSIVCAWFSPSALETYVGMKRAEIALCSGLEGEAVCARYAKVY